MLGGLCGAKSQCTKYRHKHLSPALPMWSDSGEQTVSCHNPGVRGRSQLQTAGGRRMRVASSLTKTDELVLCGLFYSGIRGIEEEDGETAYPDKGLPEQQHPQRKEEVFTMSFPFLPVISPAFTAADDAPPFSSFTQAGSVCWHIFLSWGKLTLVRLTSDEGFRAWHQVLPDNTHCSSRAVCTHRLKHLRLSLGWNPPDFGLAPLAGIAPKHINAPTTTPDFQSYMYS